jgi:D-glycero-D-manno-heptose 1,7-bisphosphate phosphatase
MTGNLRSPAVFVDRDGTLIEDVGYLSRCEDIRILPGAVEAIRKLRKAGFKIICISNQSGVARGKLSENQVREVNNRLQELLRAEEAELDAYYFCPHHPEAGEPPYRTVCRCRKPEPGMLEKAETDHAIDLSASFLIGDSIVDVAAGRRAGVRTVMVMTGPGRETRSAAAWDPDTWPDFMAEDLLEAAALILGENPHETREKESAR